MGQTPSLLFYHVGSYHGICIAVQTGHLAANGCCRSKLPVNEVERQVLQLCGSPTEVWRIPAELDPGLRIGSNITEIVYVCPIGRRALVRINVRLPHLARQKLLNIALCPASPHPSVERRNRLLERRKQFHRHCHRSEVCGNVALIQKGYQWTLRNALYPSSAFSSMRLITHIRHASRVIIRATCA
jgi:hypothetical protein